MRTTRSRFAAGSVLLMLAVGSAAAADDTEALRKENADLRQRVGSLESQLHDVKALLTQQGQVLQGLQQSGSRAASQPAPAQAAAQEAAPLDQARQEVRRQAEQDAAKKLSVWSSVDINLYGYIKLDAAWDQARTDTGDFARWVESEQTLGKDGQFNVTANETRLGMKLTGPERGGLRTRGQVEVDFYGGGTENKPVPMMRHAYMELDWPRERFSILAGQTSDVFSPLTPSTLNYSVQWWAGNIGYRRPQVRLTKVFKPADQVELKLEGAVARTIGHTTGFDPGDSGEDHCLPGLQGRVSATFPFFGPKPTTVGVSGHYAIEEYDLDARNRHRNLDSWSANLDVTQPLASWLEIKGELYTGADLDAYLGGIGQGVDATRQRTIQACGGWLALSLAPWQAWRFNVGASAEGLDRDDVTRAAARTLNRTVFGNVVYSFNEQASVGLELSDWHTDYKGVSNGDSIRLQMSFIYRF